MERVKATTFPPQKDGNLSQICNFLHSYGQNIIAVLSISILKIEINKQIDAGFDTNTCPLLVSH